ncbi:MAG: TetR/AcrR family transcriptional regulator [Actinobacteria bacterium]|nr:TetR/AcrR family transcriptional regulator [Actinomycetota bacterium]
MSPTPGAKGRAPHRRSEQARIAVLHAADDLLAERGFAAVTIEGIAARAGVAKQTIYRWWPSKVEVLLDTLIEDSEQALAVPDTGSAVEDARQYLHALASFITGDPAGKVLLALIGEAQHDEQMAGAFRTRYLEPRREAERAMLARGVAAGELSPDLDVDRALDELLGPIFYRALITGGPISRTFTDLVVFQVLG